MVPDHDATLMLWQSVIQPCHGSFVQFVGVERRKRPMNAFPCHAVGLAWFASADKLEIVHAAPDGTLFDRPANTAGCPKWSAKKGDAINFLNFVAEQPCVWCVLAQKLADNVVHLVNVIAVWLMVSRHHQHALVLCHFDPGKPLEPLVLLRAHHSIRLAKPARQPDVTR